MLSKTWHRAALIGSARNGNQDLVLSLSTKAKKMLRNMRTRSLFWARACRTILRKLMEEKRTLSLMAWIGRRFGKQVWLQISSGWKKAHVSAMNRAAWYRFAQKIRRLLVETANINLILFFCLLDGVHFTTQSLVFRGLTINTNPTLHYSGLTCSSCSQ